MDRALKERVIGAVVLVVIAVLVVPVFLDGPSTDDEMISEAVILPGQNGQPRKQQTVVLELDRDRPVPVSAGQETPNAAPATSPGDDHNAANTVASEAGPQPAPPQPGSQQEKKAPTATANATPTEAPGASAPAASAASETAPGDESDESPAASESDETAQSATGMWAVQLGSFTSKQNAEKLAADLREKGFAAFLSEWQSDSGELHRVRVGPQKDRESAEAVAAKLRAEGLKGQVVPHP